MNTLLPGRAREKKTMKNRGDAQCIKMGAKKDGRGIAEETRRHRRCDQGVREDSSARGR